MLKFLLLCLFLFVSLNADYKDGEVIFKNKCSSCHGNFIAINTLKENFFEKNNKLLNLKAPTGNEISFRLKQQVGHKEDMEFHIE